MHRRRLCSNYAVAKLQSNALNSKKRIKDYLHMFKQFVFVLQFAAFPNPPLDFQLQFILIKHANTILDGVLC